MAHFKGFPEDHGNMQRWLPEFQAIMLSKFPYLGVSKVLHLLFYFLCIFHVHMCSVPNFFSIRGSSLGWKKEGLK